MPEITVNDINLYYETYGEGIPLIFLHGFAVDHLVFSALPNYFQKDYQVVLLDNRGSGQSDCPDIPYTIEMMADDVAEFCRKLSFDSGHFVGHSMGGMILQRLAYQYPQLVRSAALCHTEMKIDIRYALTAKARLAFIAANCPPRALIENALGWTFTSSFLAQPGMIEKIIDLRLSNPFPITETGYRNQLSALLAFNSNTWVNRIKTPCLVIGADQDIIIHEANIRAMAKLIPNAHYQGISGVGHASFIEQPEKFCQILKAFLAKV